MLLLFRHHEDRPFPDNADPIHHRINRSIRRTVTIYLPSIRLHPMYFDIEYPTEISIPNVASHLPTTGIRHRLPSGTSPRRWVPQPLWKSHCMAAQWFPMEHRRETKEWSLAIRVTSEYVQLMQELVFASIEPSFCLFLEPKTMVVSKAQCNWNPFWWQSISKYSIQDRFSRECRIPAPWWQCFYTWWTCPMASIIENQFPIQCELVSSTSACHRSHRKTQMGCPT